MTERVLTWEGCLNVRDLGGHVDGGRPRDAVRGGRAGRQRAAPDAGRMASARRLRRPHDRRPPPPRRAASATLPLELPVDARPRPARRLAPRSEIQAAWRGVETRTSAGILRGVRADDGDARAELRAGGRGGRRRERRRGRRPLLRRARTAPVSVRDAAAPRRRRRSTTSPPTTGSRATTSARSSSRGRTRAGRARARPAAADRRFAAAGDGRRARRARGAPRDVPGSTCSTQARPTTRSTAHAHDSSGDRTACSSSSRACRQPGRRRWRGGSRRGSSCRWSRRTRSRRRLFDTLGVATSSGRSGSARPSIRSIFLFAGPAARAPVSSLIAEANFFRGDHERHFAALPPHRTRADPLPRAARRSARALRRTGRTGIPGHLSGLRVDELGERYASGGNGPLELEGELIELDTSRPVDVDALTARLEAVLRGPALGRAQSEPPQRASAQPGMKRSSVPIRPPIASAAPATTPSQASGLGTPSA